MENVLSQNEVNALLDAVRSGSVPTEEGGAPTDAEVKPFDLTSSGRIVRGRMPTLDMINQRLARLMRQSIFNLFRKPVEVAHLSTQLVKYGEFISSITMPASLSIFRMPPLKSSSIVSIEPVLMFGLVDHVFGGGAGADSAEEAQVEDREYSAIELRLAKQLVTMILRDVRAAWEPVLEVEPEFVRTEINPKFAGVAAPTELTIRVTFSVEIEDSTKGSISMMIPYSAIEPIRRMLSSQLQTERGEENFPWRRQIISVIRSINVEFLTLLGSGHLKLADLLALQVGDTFSLNIAANAPLPCLIEGVEKSSAWPVLSRGRVGVELEQPITAVERPIAELVTTGEQQ